MNDSTTPPRRPGVHLTSAQADRAAGVLLATACGDALGAAYEFGPPLPDDTDVAMIGGGPFGWAPGEWTDDTSMAIPIARAAATGADLRDEAVLDGIAAAWVELGPARPRTWACRPPRCCARPHAIRRLRLLPSRRGGCTTGPGAPPATAR